jgi:hypothetical protein
MNQQLPPKVKDKAQSTVRAIANTPGWVWILIGGVVLLIVGMVAARAALPNERDFA